jgi:hypothetical protein
MPNIYCKLYEKIIKCHHNLMRPSLIPLKGQCHEIFYLWLFRQSITHRPQMNTLKYFRILFQIS